MMANVQRHVHQTELSAKKEMQKIKRETTTHHSCVHFRMDSHRYLIDVSSFVDDAISGLQVKIIRQVHVSVVYPVSNCWKWKEKKNWQNVNTHNIEYDAEKIRMIFFVVWNDCGLFGRKRELYLSLYHKPKTMSAHTHFQCLD